MSDDLFFKHYLHLEILLETTWMALWHRPDWEVLTWL